MAAKRLAVLVSGNGSNLQALIDSCKARFLSCDIVLTLSNNKNAFALRRAKEANIPTEVLDYSNYDERETYDAVLTNVVQRYNPDYVVLAGWMRILTPTFINSFPNRLINLHPALPGSFKGTDCIKRTWEARENSDTKSGVMVHRVIEEVDMGEVLSTMSVPFKSGENFDEYEERMHQAERSLLVATVKNLTDNPVQLCNDCKEKYSLTYTGKVRNVHDIGHNLLAIRHSNRLSAFDRHICEVPMKGSVLTATSAWWFKKIEKELGIKSHFVWANNEVMVAKKCKVFPVEMVVRGYMTGSTQTSIWPMYKSGKRDMYGLTFRDGYQKNEKLDEVILTPTTKGEVDEPITLDEIVMRGLMTKEHLQQVAANTLRIFEWGQKVAAERDLILVDSKLEWGLSESGELLLVDEVFTCDSSRFWFLPSYETKMSQNLEPEKFDKDVCRDWIKKNVEDPYKMSVFNVPNELKLQTKNTYMKFYSQLTGDNLTDNSQEQTMDVNMYNGDYAESFFVEKSDVVAEEVDFFFQNYYPIWFPTVVVLAGSESDHKHVEKIKKACEDQKMRVEVHYGSAHKQTEKVLRTITEYNTLKGKVVFVTVAGMSNALSGVTACNTQYPVIACPPFADKADQMVNINSTLQMPSKVPTATILSPGNVALFIRRMFDLC